MREVINIHIGQAGLQVGNECWKIFNLEHEIDAQGQKEEYDDDSNGDQQESDQFKSFYRETDSGRFVPRSIMIDLDPEVIDEIKVGEFRDLYTEDQFVAGKENAKGNFALGHSLGKEVIDSCLDQIRKLAQDCDDL